MIMKGRTFGLTKLVLILNFNIRRKLSIARCDKYLLSFFVESKMAIGGGLKLQEKEAESDDSNMMKIQRFVLF